MLGKKRTSKPKPAPRKAMARKPVARKRPVPRPEPAPAPELHVTPEHTVHTAELVAAALDHLANTPQHAALRALADQMHDHIDDMRGSDDEVPIRPARARSFHRT